MIVSKIVASRGGEGERQLLLFGLYQQFKKRSKRKSGKVAGNSFLGGGEL